MRRRLKRRRELKARRRKSAKQGEVNAWKDEKGRRRTRSLDCEKTRRKKRRQMRASESSCRQPERSGARNTEKGHGNANQLNQRAKQPCMKIHESVTKKSAMFLVQQRNRKATDQRYPLIWLIKKIISAYFRPQFGNQLHLLIARGCVDYAWLACLRLIWPRHWAGVQSNPEKHIKTCLHVILPRR